LLGLKPPKVTETLNVSFSQRPVRCEDINLIVFCTQVAAIGLVEIRGQDVQPSTEVG